MKNKIKRLLWLLEHTNTDNENECDLAIDKCTKFLQSLLKKMEKQNE